MPTIPNPIPSSSDQHASRWRVVRFLLRQAVRYGGPEVWTEGDGRGGAVINALIEEAEREGLRVR